MSPSGAKDFYQARLSNFGTIVGQGPPLMPYLRNSTTTAGAGGHESTSLKNLRGLDTLLGSVGLSAGFKQVCHYVECVFCLRWNKFFFFKYSFFC